MGMQCFLRMESLDLEVKRGLKNYIRQEKLFRLAKKGAAKGHRSFKKVHVPVHCAISTETRKKYFDMTGFFV
jgi:hypothetical protein